MATIHTGTTLVPTKLELLTDWMPRQSWYRESGRPPALSRAGGFRLDDPAGEVGIEFMFVADEGTTYFVPVSYRGAPLAGAEEALIGTTQHGVLGRRWVYDGAQDPVVTASLRAFLDGEIEAQHQSRSDTVDPTVVAHRGSGSRTGTVEIVRIPEPGDSAGVDCVEAGWTGADDTEVRGTVVILR